MTLALLAVSSLLLTSPDPVRQADLADLRDLQLDPDLDAAGDAWLQAQRRGSGPASLWPDGWVELVPESRRGAVQARLTGGLWWSEPQQRRWSVLAAITISFDRLFRLGRAVAYRPPRLERMRQRRCAALFGLPQSELEHWSRRARGQALGCWTRNPAP